MSLTIPEKHQLTVARKTLRMHDSIVGVMGGPTKKEAREIIRRLEAKRKSGRHGRRGLSGLKRKSGRKSKRKSH